MRWLIFFGPILGVCVLIGCSAGAPESYEAGSAVGSAKKEAAQGLGGKPGREAEPQVRQDAALPEKAEAPPAPNEPVKRKIIFTGRVELLVEKYETAVNELKALVKNLKGFVTNSDDSGSPGAQRSGNYTIRVPVDNFERFMEDVALLGELRRRTTDSQDISDQYYDTEAHMKNDQVREQGLQKLYDKTAEKGRIEDLLHVDRELSGIRGKIDEEKGRLKRWDSQTSYSTVTVTLQQRKDYDPAGTPGFGTTVSRTWEGSLNALATFGKGVVLFVVAVTPWLAVLLVITSPLWYLLWRNLAKKRTAKPTPEPPATVLPA
jgi:hypothetical protein